MSEGKLIYRAIPAIIAEVGPVGKNSKNQQQGYNYRSADDISDALHDSFAKHGVFVTCKIESCERGERPSKSGGSLQVASVKAVYTFHASDGSSISTEAVGDGMDSGDKAVFKALTGAFKYVLLPTFMLMGHEDAERDSPEVAPSKPKSKAKEVADSHGMNTANELPLSEKEKARAAECMAEADKVKSEDDLKTLWKAGPAKERRAYQDHVKPHFAEVKGRLLQPKETAA